jgi:hypothetical protein
LKKWRNIDIEKQQVEYLINPWLLVLSLI